MGYIAISKAPEWLTKDGLLQIEGWARNGLTEGQIAKNIGISQQTFDKWKKRHTSILEALKKGKRPLIIEIENALVKKALGFEYEEIKTYVKIEGGKEVKYQEKMKRYSPPDTAACIILLKNKDRDENGKAKWSNEPMKIELDRETLELRKKVEELKLF